MGTVSFLPYQQKWLEDKAQKKFCIKSRRIGMTYAQSYEDVEDCIAKRVPKVFFSSADESAAREYIEYCEMWAKKFNKAARLLGEKVLDEERGIKSLDIEFVKNSVVYAQIHALTSNPRRFRSKGGKIVLDEFDWHDQPLEMWRAALPATTWGFPIRVLSSLNGKRLLWKFVKDCESGKMKGSPHRITIFDAVDQGLADKIAGKKLTKDERDAWLKEIHDSCGDEDTWRQEYCCEPIDESTAFLPYDLIEAVEDPGILIDDLGAVTGDLYLGGDIARKKDLTVFWVIEKTGRLMITRKVIELRNTPFAAQEKQLDTLLRHPKLRRACLDCTGLGMQLAETAQKKHGKYRVEGVTFTGKVKEDLAYSFRNRIEDRIFIVPADSAIREDFHSIRKLATSAGNIRFDVAREGTDGHADRFWAAALANHAVSEEKGPITAAVRDARETEKIYTGYDGPRLSRRDRIETYA